MSSRLQRPTVIAAGALAELAERAFARAAGSPSTDANAVRLLCDARENYPAWKDALAKAERYILFESYIVEDDDVGREFAAILTERARAGQELRNFDTNLQPLREKIARLRIEVERFELSLRIAIAAARRGRGVLAA